MADIKDAKGFREVDTCKTCDHFVYTSLEWIGRCTLYDASFNFIDPKDHICDDHTTKRMYEDER